MISENGKRCEGVDSRVNVQGGMGVLIRKRVRRSLEASEAGDDVGR